MSGSESDTEDWDADFEADDEPRRTSLTLPVSTAPLKITGVVAKATDDIEDWDQDFLDHDDLDHDDAASPRLPSPSSTPPSMATMRQGHSRFGMHMRAHRHKSLASDRLDSVAQRLLRLRSAAYSLASDEAALKMRAALAVAESAAASSSSDAPKRGTSSGESDPESECARASAALSEARDECAVARTGVALAEAHWRAGHVDAALSEAVTALRVLDGASSAALSTDERARLRARLLLVQARTAHAQQDAFKAARALKQAASTLADMEHRDEALFARVHHELAHVLDEREQGHLVADALITVVSALLTLSTWSAEQGTHVATATLRLAEYALRCDDLDVTRVLTRALNNFGEAALPPVSVERSRNMQRELSAATQERERKSRETSEHEAYGGSGAPGLPGSVVDSDEASDWDLELSLTAQDEDGPSLGSLDDDRSGKSAAATVATSAATTAYASKRSDSASESDWDKEFANSDEDSADAATQTPSQAPPQPHHTPHSSTSSRTPLARNLGYALNSAASAPSAPTPQASRKALLSLAQAPRIDVKRYELLPEKTSFKAVKYPPPTFLYTLRTKENHKLMNESQLEAWLLSLQFRQKDLLQSKNQPPSLRDLDVATETFLRGHHAHWAWQALASGGALAWDQVTKAFEKIDKHIQASVKRGTDPDRFDAAMADLVHFVTRHTAPVQLQDALAVLRVFADYSPSTRPVARLLEGALYGHQQVHNPIGIFCKVYQRAKRAELALTARDLLAHDDFSPVGLQARALAYLHLYLVERSPLTTAKQVAAGEVSEESSEDEIIDTLCNDDAQRLQLLNALYGYLKPSYLKAECAYVLALHALDNSDTALAERIAFETVYILATIEPAVKGLSHLLTPLGSNALALYGDVLRANSKYKYAALAFEAALSVLRILGNTEEYNALLESFAKISHAENDLRRSVNCYSEIVSYYQQQQHYKDRRNEIIYVSEILGTMFVELGDFISAEGYIHTALQFFPAKEGVPDTRPSDPTYVRLQILLAHTHLLSLAFEKGITLLEWILSFQLPLRQEKQVTEMLLSAYRKKGWVKEASKLLESFKMLVDQEEKESGVQNAPDLIKFWKLAALHFFKSEQFKAAMCCVDKAIMITDISSFAVLGRLYLLRGKILLEMCKHPGSITFPTSFQPDTKIEMAGETLTTTISYTTFGSTGDLIQECVATLKQASFYFEGTGDDVHLGHTMTCLSEVLLELCFPPVALYDATFVDIASLPYFHPSFIAQNTREAQKRKREQQEHRRQKTMQRESERLKEKRKLRDTKRSAYLPNPIASPKDHSATPSQFSGFTNFILPKAFVSGDFSRRRTTGDQSGAPTSASSAGSTLSTSGGAESAFLNPAHTTQIYVEPDREVLLVLVLGWSGVGRTSIMARLIKGYYTEQVQPSAHDEISELLVFQGRKVRFLSPKFNPAHDTIDKVLERLPRKQLRGALLCYDVTRRDSFDAFVEWWDASAAARSLPAVLIGNRAGEGEQREVVQTHVGEWVSARQLKCFDVSAKEGLGLHDALSALIESIDAAILEHDVIPITLTPDGQVAEPASPPAHPHPTSHGAASAPGSVASAHTRAPTHTRTRSSSHGHTRRYAVSLPRAAALASPSVLRHSGVDAARLHSSGSGVGVTYSQSKSDAEESDSDSQEEHAPSQHLRTLSGGSEERRPRAEDAREAAHEEPEEVPASPTSAHSKLLQLPAQFVVRLEQVREATELGLDLANDCAHLYLLLRGHLNMAELHFLEGDTSLALQFFEQCTRHLIALFVARDHSLLRDAPPAGLRKLLNVVRRALRFLVCQSKDVFNAHLRLVDLYHTLQHELDAALRRELPSIDVVLPPTTAHARASSTSAVAAPTSAALLSRRRLSGVVLSQSAAAQGAAAAPGPASAVPSLPASLVVSPVPAAGSAGAAGGSGAAGGAAGSGATPAMPHLSSSLSVPREREEKRHSFRQSLSLALDFGKSGGSARAESELAMRAVERRRLAVAKKCALAWGFQHFVKQQAERYVEGKLALEALRTTSQRSYRKMAKIAAMLRAADDEALLDTTDTPRMRRRRSSVGTVGTLHRVASRSTSSALLHAYDSDDEQAPAQPPRSAGKGDATLGKDSSENDAVALAYSSLDAAALERLVVVLQLDEHIVYYAAGSGRRRVQRLAPRSATTAVGGNGSGANSGDAPAVSLDAWLPVEVSLLSGAPVVHELVGAAPATTTLQLSVRASCTLEALLRYISDDALASQPLYTPSTAPAAAPTQKERSKTGRSLFSIFTPLFGDKKGKDKDRSGGSERSDAHTPPSSNELVRLIARDPDFSAQLRALATTTPTNSPSPLPRRTKTTLGPAPRRTPEQRKGDSDSESSDTPPPPPTPSSTPGGEGAGGEGGGTSESSSKGASDEAWGARLRLARRAGATVHSLHARMSARLRDAFSASELQRALTRGARAPLRLVAYNAEDTRAAKTVQDDAVLLSDSLQRYLATLALSAHDERGALEDVAREFRHAFSGLSDVLPSSGPTATLSGFATIRGDAWRVSDPDAPLVLLCSPALHAVPWELLLDEARIVRTFTLREYLRSRALAPTDKDRIDAQAPTHTTASQPPPPQTHQGTTEGDTSGSSGKESPRARLAQQLWVVGAAQSRGSLEAEVAARKMALKRLLLHRLRLVRRYELPRPPSARWPLPSVLVTRSSSLLRQEGVRVLDALTSEPLPHRLPLRLNLDAGAVLVLALSDLLEMSDALVAVRALERPPTLLFVPDAHVKRVVRVLLKAHSQLLKRAKTETGLLRCDTLLDTLRSLWHDEHIALCVFNPPWGR